MEDALGGSGGPVRLDAVQAAAVEAIVTASAPVLVTGGPGTGKTEVLVSAVGQLVRQGVGLDRIVVLSHARAGAQRLRRRLMAHLEGAFFDTHITTVHGWCRQVQAGLGAPDVRLLAAPEQEFRVRELLDEIGPQLWPPELALAARTQAFAGQVRDLMLRTRQLGLDPDDLVAQGRATGRPAWESAGRFFEAYLDAIDAEQVIDYAELVHRTRILVASASARASLRAGVRLVLVDELAEFDPAQWGLLRDVWAAGVPVVGFADASTSVFGFWGAVSRPVEQFERSFAGPDGRLARFDLRHTWRGSPGVAAACARLAAHMPNGAAPVEQEDDTADEGAAQVWVCGSARARDGALAQWLRTAHVDDGVPWSQMAVLGQTADAELAEVARGLAGAGIPVQLDGDGTGLADTPAVRQFLPVLALIAQWSEQGQPTTDLVQRGLASRLAGIDAVEARRLARQLRAAQPQLALLRDGPLLAQVFSQDRSDAAQDDRIGRLRTAWGDAVQVLRDGGDVPGLLWALWSSGAWPAQARADALSGGLAAPQANADLDAVMALFDLAGQHPDWCGPAGLRRFLALLGQFQIESDTARESDPRGLGVQVMGVRRALGRGWPIVAVIGAAEGRWPRPGEAATLLEPDALRPRATDLLEGAAVSPLRAQQQAFLLACSRAERRLAVVCAPATDAETARVSRFALQLGVPCIGMPEAPRAASGMAGLVAGLRRASLDAQASPALREDAVRLLRGARQLRDDAGAPLAPTADPVTWWGVRAASGDVGATSPATVVLTGSSLTSLLACPRRWFLSRRARGDLRPGPRAALGTLLHEVFRRDADGTFGAQAAAALLDERWDTLGFATRWQSQAARAEAQQMYERFVRWRDGRPDRELVAVEAPFTWALECDGLPVQVTGVVDRLERDAQGRLAVVDFKTGRTEKSREHRDQVALYELAVGQGVFPGLDLGQPPRPAAPPELVWPAVQASTRDECKLKVCTLASLADHPHDESVEFDAPAYPTWAHARLAVAARIVHAGRFDARSGPACSTCPFFAGCPAQTEAAEEV